MILDSITNAGTYRFLGDSFVAGLEYLARFDPITPAGRYSIDGEKLFAIVDRYDTCTSMEKQFESHQRYVDIQFVVSGRERILHAPIDSLVVDALYDGEKDITLYAEPRGSSSFLLGPGQFAIFFPSDGHKPGLMAGGRDSVLKVVVKVRVLKSESEERRVK